MPSAGDPINTRQDRNEQHTITNVSREQDRINRIDLFKHQRKNRTRKSVSFTPCTKTIDGCSSSSVMISCDRTPGGLLTPGLDDDDDVAVDSPPKRQGMTADEITSRRRLEQVALNAVPILRLPIFPFSRASSAPTPQPASASASASAATSPTPLVKIDTPKPAGRSQSDQHDEDDDDDDDSSAQPTSSFIVSSSHHPLPSPPPPIDSLLTPNTFTFPSNPTDDDDNSNVTMTTLSDRLPCESPTTTTTATTTLVGSLSWNVLLSSPIVLPLPSPSPHGGGTGRKRPLEETTQQQQQQPSSTSIPTR